MSEAGASERTRVMREVVAALSDLDVVRGLHTAIAAADQMRETSRAALVLLADKQQVPAPDGYRFSVRTYGRPTQRGTYEDNRNSCFGYRGPAMVNPESITTEYDETFAATSIVALGSSRVAVGPDNTCIQLVDTDSVLVEAIPPELQQ